MTYIITAPKRAAQSWEAAALRGALRVIAEFPTYEAAEQYYDNELRGDWDKYAIEEKGDNK